MWELIRARYRHRQALLLYRAGQDLEAVELASRAVRLLRRWTAGRNAPSTEELVGALATHAQILTDLTRLDEAAGVYAAALALLDTDSTSVSARSDPAQVATLHIAQADVRRRLARYAGAGAALASAATQIELAGRPQDLLACWHNISGIVAKETGRFSDAQAHYAAATQLCGEDNELRASLQHNLAGLAYMQRDFAAAERPARAALELRRHLQGAKSTGVAADSNVLGAVLAEIDQFDEAEEHLTNALGIWRDRFGPDHYEVAATLHTLAATHQKRGDLDGALEEFHEALRIKTEVLGPQHPEVAILLSNIGNLQAKMGRSDEALRYHKRAWSSLNQAYGPTHPFTVRVAAHLGPTTATATRGSGTAPRTAKPC